MTREFLQVGLFYLALLSAGMLLFRVYERFSSRGEADFGDKAELDPKSSTRAPRIMGGAPMSRLLPEIAREVATLVAPPS